MQQAPTPVRSVSPATSDGLGRELARGLREGLLEIAVWAAALVVFVGLPAWLGYLLGDGLGLLIGAALGAVVLGIVWLVLMALGIGLLAATVRRSWRG